ncbi:MAG: hypothetical protein P1U56_26965 [Saprospiraceae bacterium]|nr:hypothetical protein [Saprospiraceae bacterium]
MLTYLTDNPTIRSVLSINRISDNSSVNQFDLTIHQTLPTVSDPVHACNSFFLKGTASMFIIIPMKCTILKDQIPNGIRRREIFLLRAPLYTNTMKR